MESRPAWPRPGRGHPRGATADNGDAQLARATRTDRRYADCCSVLQEGFMTNFVFAIIVGAVVAVNGCVAETEGVAIGELTASVAETTASVAETTAPVAETTAPVAETSAAARFCFTCDLDPSVRACSSIASRAQHICQRACIVCDDFGDNIGDCFVGQCEPDFE
jgi:hypothetical protein